MSPWLVCPITLAILNLLSHVAMHIVLSFWFLRTPLRFLAFIDRYLIIEGIPINLRWGNRFWSVCYVWFVPASLPPQWGNSTLYTLIRKRYLGLYNHSHTTFMSSLGSWVSPNPRAEPQLLKGVTNQPWSIVGVVNDFLDPQRVQYSLLPQGEIACNDNETPCLCKDTPFSNFLMRVYTL